MKLERMSHAERLKLCRQYYYIGMFCLPLVWLTNVVWFYRFAFCTDDYEEKKAMRFYILASLAGLLFWLFVFVTWISIFQIYSVQGLEWVDRITMIFPLGRV